MRRKLSRTGDLTEVHGSRTHPRRDLRRARSFEDWAAHRDGCTSKCLPIRHYCCCIVKLCFNEQSQARACSRNQLLPRSQDHLVVVRAGSGLRLPAGNSRLRYLGLTRCAQSIRASSRRRSRWRMVSSVRLPPASNFSRALGTTSSGFGNR